MRSIISSTDMAKAILEGRETQTRRIIKPQSEVITGDILQPYIWYAANKGDFAGDPNRRIKCPYQIGQTLWVRETWGIQGSKGYTQKEFFNLPEMKKYNIEYWKSVILYKASDDFNVNWWPSIFMPQWASRINLEVTDISVERLQDISEDDAKAEGMFFVDYGTNCYHPKPCLLSEYHEYHQQKNGWSWKNTKSDSECFGSARLAFVSLWNSLNKKRGYGWEVNPYVWRIQFQKVKNEH